MSKYKDVKEFVVKRSQWLRGDFENSYLADNTGKKCCLGFYSCAAGFLDKDIKMQGAPNELVDSSGKVWDTFLLGHPSEDSEPCNSDACFDLMSINDYDEYDDAEREDLLKEKFAEHGVKVTFID